MVYKKVLTAFFLLVILCLFLIKKEEQKTFTFWTVQLRSPAGDLIEKNIEKFKEKYPNYKVVWVDIPITEAKKRTIAAILGGNPPDLINLNPEFSLILAQKNSLEFFNEEDAKDYNKGLVDKLKYEGKIYALPFYATSAVTILNKEKFKNSTVNLKTYEDILKLKNQTFGIALNEGDTFSKIINKYNNELEYTYDLFKQINDNGFLLKDALTVNHREVVEKYMSGSASFITAGSNFITMIEQNAPDIYKNSIVLPQITGSTGGYDVSLMNFVIPKLSKNKDEAKEFIKILLSYENQIELAKKTNVLPANQKALDDKYFKNCSMNPKDSARCIASKQLDFPVQKNFGDKNKNEINELINENLEILFLKNKMPDFKTLKENLKLLTSN